MLLLRCQRYRLTGDLRVGKSASFKVRRKQTRPRFRSQGQAALRCPQLKSRILARASGSKQRLLLIEEILREIQTARYVRQPELILREELCQTGNRALRLLACLLKRLGERGGLPCRYAFCITLERCRTAERTELILRI